MQTTLGEFGFVSAGENTVLPVVGREDNNWDNEGDGREANPKITTRTIVGIMEIRIWEMVVAMKDLATSGNDWQRLATIGNDWKWCRQTGRKGNMEALDFESAVIGMVCIIGDVDKAVL